MIADQIADIPGDIGQDETTPQIQMATDVVNLKARR